MNTVQQKYKYAVIATDVIIFTVRKRKLYVLLMKMQKKPFFGMYALPGGLINSDESIDDAAARILLEKTGMENVYLEQLKTFGQVDRDPFGRVVSVAYFALVPAYRFIKLKADVNYENVGWFPVDAVPTLAYDHTEMLATAVEQLKKRLGYSNIAYNLLPPAFTLTELQSLYELILGEALDKRNFRKKILSLDVLKPTGKEQRGNANRPAALYRFSKRKPHMVRIFDH
ncbi:MAG TPA: NUDIX domain-containing protein [Candidatus Andersenbacteria bacterium]|nr:NUDIX domain-containing protein [Candidatus Andersenbacteria bacterium]